MDPYFEIDYETPKTHPAITLRKLGVKLVCKDDSVLMRIVSMQLFWNKRFMTSYFTTITLPWFRRIYYPVGMTLQEAQSKKPTLWHELKHVRQAIGDDRWYSGVRAIGFSVAYLFLWLPMFGAYFRMRWECEAYAVSYVENRGKYQLGPYAKWVAEALWKDYLWAWPKDAAAVRFLNEVAKLERGQA